MKFYPKIVAITTAFVGGSAGVFLVTGAGAPVLRILVWLIFLLCLLNVSIYFREFFKWLQKTIQSAGAHLAATGKPPPKPGDGKPGGDGGKPGGDGKPGGGPPPPKQGDSGGGPKPQQ